MITHLWQEKSKPHVKKQKDIIDSLMSPEEIKWGFRASYCHTVLDNFTT